MLSKSFDVCVVGAGLAGSECAWQLAKQGLSVALVEMRPAKATPAHKSGLPAEMVCSNSLRSNDIYNAVGLIKHEMGSLGSLIMQAAYACEVPAGSALAVDRDSFAQFIDKKLNTCDKITRMAGEVVAVHKNEKGMGVCLAGGETVFATRVVLSSGPLTSDALASWLKEITQSDYLYFYDAIAPIVDAASINMDKAFRASRYGKDTGEEGDYINCPMTREEYTAFIDAIEKAELAPVHDFDKAQFFEGCLPIEEMVRRGRETLCYGPLKPIGLVDPRTPDLKYAAVVQLRQDNLHASLFNMVGFQTRMKWGEQKRILQMIPGLKNAEFVRFGSMHRNTYVCSPVLLNDNMELKVLPGVHLAGQMTGCEGYVESAAVGLMVSRIIGALIKKGVAGPLPPNTTALGALLHHILHADPKEYQPMNINFGLMPEITGRIKRKEKRYEMVGRAMQDFDRWKYRSQLC